MIEPNREIFWNIQNAWIMYSLAAIAVAVLVWSLIRIPPPLARRPARQPV